MPQEREVKLEVGEAFSLPDLSHIAGLRVVDRGVRLLHATYWDTAALDLMRGGYGLRYRTTDGEAGTWTLKGSSRADGAALLREEVDVAGTPDQPPRGALDLLPAQLSKLHLLPVATVSTERHLLDLHAGGGARWAELADDRVAVLDGERVAARFHEVEVEVTGSAGDDALAAVGEALTAAGARPPDVSSKYVRALQLLGRLDPA